MAAIAPVPALAHVKWFEDPAPYPLRTDLVWSDRTAIVAVVALGAAVTFYLLSRLLGDPHWPRVAFLRKMAIGAPTLLAVQAAIGLVHAAVQPALFAPQLALGLDPIGYGLAALQLAIAFSFITGIADWLGAFMLFLLGPVGFLLFPAMDVLDQLFWVGIGVVLLVIGRFAVEAGQPRPWFYRRNPAWSSRAVALLRIITGLGIIAPALSEKIWNPGLGAAFLQSHPQFNVMRSPLGQAWFSDDLFVMVAGTVELTIGVLLITGLLTRVVILFMWVPFNLGVPFLPPQELLGHLPIFGIMYFLLVHSAGIAPGESLDRQAPPGSPSARPSASPASDPSEPLPRPTSSAARSTMRTPLPTRGKRAWRT